MDRPILKIFSHLPVLLVVWIAIAVLAPQLKRGGAARREKRGLVYGLRPGMKVVGCWMIVISALVLWFLSREVIQRGHLVESPLLLGFAIAFFLSGAYFLSMYFFLDTEGLHYVRLGKKTTIPWTSMDHFEIRHDARAASEQYFFRSKDGTSIAVSELTHDAKHLLAQVRINHPMGSKPYKSRHWFGG